jgi:hypothetical protein
MSRPFQRMAPPPMRSSPMIARSSVDLPTPLRPSTAAISPDRTESETPRRRSAAP